MDEVSHMADIGVDYGKPKLDIANLRGRTEEVIGKLTGGLAASGQDCAKSTAAARLWGEFVRQPTICRWSKKPRAQRQERNRRETQVVRFQEPDSSSAAGSQAVRLPFMPNDPRVVDSTGALATGKKYPSACRSWVAASSAWKWARSTARCGARLDVVEMMDGLMQGADRDLVKVWQKMNAHALTTSCSKPKLSARQATAKGIEVTL
jgi:dihydrolipoamide dehydrogenase